MAKISALHFKYIETAHTGSGIPGFRIVNADEEEVGQIYFSLRHDQYMVEIIGTSRWIIYELAEVTNFAKRLQDKVGVG